MNQREKNRSHESDPLSEFHSRPWTEAHDVRLTELVQKHLTVSELAFELKRTESGIRERLKVLGLEFGQQE